MTPLEQKNLSSNLLITVNDNSRQGACSITDWFKDSWKTGIGVIDQIDTKINDNAISDGIVVTTKDTKEVVLEIKGQRALLLNTLSEGLISLLEIKITR